MRFFRVWLVLATIVGLVDSGAAADMPVKAVPMKAPFAPSFSWTGFYVGVHAGWGGDNPTGATSVGMATFPTTLTSQHDLDLGAHGPLFGGHAGYNWQINPRLVVGIEGDITGTGIKASGAQSAFCPTPFCTPATVVPGALFTMSQEVNWLASIRGRLGTIWGPGLIYVTGGAAWANVETKANIGDAFFGCGGGGIACTYSAASNVTKTGWAAGAGYETALAGNWTVRAEYLYYSFGGQTLTAGAPAANCGAPPCIATFTSSDLNIHTVRAGLTYKLGQPAGAPMAALTPRAIAAAHSWSGLYAGIDAGWGWNDLTATSVNSVATAPAVLSAQHDLGASGPLFGGHIGYNWQIDPKFVIGVEGDIVGTGIKASSAQTPSCDLAFCQVSTARGAVMTMSQEVNWLASVRGRVGAVWGPGMIYATGGAAWANVDYKGDTGDAFFGCTTSVGGCEYPAASNATKTGWVAGGGYEATLIGNWTVRAEYLYYSFGGETLVAAPTPTAGCTAFAPCTTNYTFPDLKIHTARAGVSYKF
ncbi:outer membrane protein [Rhodoplanes sp. Z2-YC6860]|uniref:outer membrane protein n=1 Tax=Rhodoplanes sp. Z2-YC6860 TaxID=674703 RepID=UPI00078E433C|nr:outer membrane beta-barrel protein [Rhodoplanes sp. Z2-YC6860]AMN43063.1 outer-membrane immunogenic protein [Rhodoplanes sp. Z2-YC6860]